MGQLELKKGISWHIVLLLICVSGINFLYMPAFRIPGDPVAIEIASINLINYGSLSVPKKIASNFGDRGQFFFENPRNGKWYSKYGLANTFIMAIPLYLEKVFTGDLQYQSNNRLLFLNLFNIFLTIFLFYYVYQLSTFYTNRLWINLAFSLSVFYCTYLSYYIRAQGTELYQTLFFTGFIYHSIMAMRCNGYSRSGFNGFKLNLHQMLSLVFLGLCCLVKVIYILIIPGFLFIILHNTRKYRHNGKKRDIISVISDALTPLIFLIFLGLFIGLINYYEFGSVFETGYGQWENEYKFSMGNILPHLLSSLIHPQNSLIINFPIILFSLFGIKIFLNKYHEEALFIALTILPVYILIFSFDNWTGDWTYGPRYCLFALPVLALPSILFYENLKRKVIKSIFAVIICLSFLFSAFLNFNVNSLNYFFTYRIKFEIISDIENAYIKEYFEKVHFGLIAYDLIRFRDDGKKLNFLIALNNFMDPSEIQKIESQILERLHPNYYWFSRVER